MLQPFPGLGREKVRRKQECELIAHIVQGELPSGWAGGFQGEADFVIGFKEGRDKLRHFLHCRDDVLAAGTYQFLKIGAAAGEAGEEAIPKSAR